MDEPLALHGGPRSRTEPWRSWPQVHDEDERLLLETYRTGFWGVGGKRVPELACRYAGLHDAKYAVCCANGTVALEIALVAAGIEPGDEVITSPYTFMATVAAIFTAGAVPVFADVEPETHNIDPDAVEAAITDKTRAVMPVHIGGRPADMDRIGEIAERHGLKIVEDAAQGWLASWNGTPVGAIGDAGTFSFQSSKNLSSGEGGIVLTNDEQVYRRAWSYHNCGRTPDGAWYEHGTAGVNYRMTELSAALLLAGLDRLPEQQRARCAAMETLASGLAGLEGISIPSDDPRVTAHGAHIFMVRLDPEALGVTREPVIEALRAEGVPASPGYTTPLTEQTFVEWFASRPAGGGKTWRELHGRSYEDVPLPVCKRLCDTTVWIKQDVLLAGPEAMGDVVHAFEKVVAAARSGRLDGKGVS